MNRFLAAILVAIFFLAACKEHGGDEYLGKWVHLKSEKRTMEIVRNGETYIVRNTEPSLTAGKFDTANIPAAMSDEGLKINNGFGTIVLVVDKSTGHLTSVLGEFKKVN